MNSRNTRVGDFGMRQPGAVVPLAAFPSQGPCFISWPNLSHRLAADFSKPAPLKCESQNLHFSKCVSLLVFHRDPFLLKIPQNPSLSNVASPASGPEFSSSRNLSFSHCFSIRLGRLTVALLQSHQKLTFSHCFSIWPGNQTASLLESP